MNMHDNRCHNLILGILTYLILPKFRSAEHGRMSRNKQQSIAFH